MARAKKWTLTDLDRRWGDRISSVTVDHLTGFVKSFTLAGSRQDQVKADKPLSEQDLDAVDLAFNPPAGMVNPVPVPEQEQN